MNDILLGAIAMASMVAALFFLRFWRSTRDRFFLFFALSFLIEGLNRVLLVPNSISSEDVPEYYLVRLLSYALILFAIWDKNRPRKK
ncbi:DUF5985 family protein [Noviherbaspirillum sp.]|uniref:DUF5985 family protein n=1 Tax=Noviherbaspirillum sp. TaxID=1926288 RepID=UPI002FE13CAF